MSEGAAAGLGRRPDTPPTAISLYAVQALRRPLRLSLYSWASRGKTQHRLLLNWKGPSSSAWGYTPQPEPPVYEPSCANSVVCLPWETENRGGRAHSADPAGCAPAPVQIAVACPEPSPAPIAPAFDGGGVIAPWSGEGQAGAVGIKAGGGPPVGTLGVGRGQTEVVRRKRVKFSVEVKVVGPPRVVLEGR